MASATLVDAERWRDVNQLLTRDGPFAAPGFEPSGENLQSLREAKILVVGAGGLGYRECSWRLLAFIANMSSIDSHARSTYFEQIDCKIPSLLP